MATADQYRGRTFNDLPDDILPHILSFLDIRLAVRTSLVSRRWRNMWKDISALNLSRSSVVGGAPATFSEFKQHVCKILQSLRSHHRGDDHRSTVTRINYEIFQDDPKEHFDLFNSVVKYARGGGLEDLSVVITLASWDSGTRVDFSDIAGCIAAHHNQSLKTLSLERMLFLTTYYDDAYYEDVDVVANKYGFDSLTSLTTLELSRCRFGWKQFWCIGMLPSLKYLKLLDCVSFHPGTVWGDQLLGLEIRNYSGDSLEIDQVIAPKLRSFRFSCFLMELGRFGRPPLTLSSLDHATICLVGGEEFFGRVKTVEELTRAFENFMSPGLRNAKSLDLHFALTVKSLRPRESLINGLVKATKSLILYQVSPFTRLRSLRIRYPLESSDQVISYHFEGSRAVEENICYSKLH